MLIYPSYINLFASEIPFYFKEGELHLLVVIESLS